MSSMKNKNIVKEKVPYGYWNSKKHCLEEAQKYETRTSFARNSPTAYEKCLKNGWDEAFSKMKQILNYSHTYEECEIVALKCKSKAQMQREYPKQYAYAYRHHFLNNIFEHLPKVNPITKEQVIEAASKCKLRQEFRLRFPREYRFTVRHHLLNEICKDMLVMHDMSERCIYAFEFPDKHVYVGLTCNIERRKCEHFKETKSAVFLHIEETGLQPILMVKHDFIDFYKARELEGIILRDYVDNDWVALNRIATGGIGCKGTIYSQLKACTERIKFCENFKQFEERFPNAYRICLEHDWFEILEEYLGTRKGDYFIPKRGFKKTQVPQTLSLNFVERMRGQTVSFRYTNKELFEEANKYSCKNEFCKKNNAAYRQAKTRGIINIVFPNNPRHISYEKLINEASKYSNRMDFKKGSNAAYQMAIKRNVLDELCQNMPYHGYKNKRMMLAAKYKLSNNNTRKYWTKDKILKECKKYTSITEFIDNSSGAYDAARNMGIMNEIKEILIPKITYWTDEMLANEASIFNKRVEFQRKSTKAYNVAWKRGILDKICSHMDKRIQWTYEMLAEEASKYDNKSDFYKKSKKAYNVAYKRGILQEICFHMDKNSPTKKGNFKN